MVDRAVSDVLGYALVFALIVSMVGLVYTTGLSGLQDVREAEKLTNAERAFDVLDANIDDIAHGKTDSRGTEIKLQNARLGFGDPVHMNVTIEGGDSYTATFRPIFFESDTGGPRIVEINGAIIRSESGGSVMLSDPSFIFGETTVVPMIYTRTRDAGVAGSGRVLVRTVSPTRSVAHVDVPAGNQVTINVTTPRTNAWRDYFERASDGTCSTTGNSVICTITPDEVYVQFVAVDVSLE
ncbi:MAG: hypothetical protein ABEJ67_02380 [Halanaeroarchaeum sp.]